MDWFVLFFVVFSRAHCAFIRLIIHNPFQLLRSQKNVHLSDVSLYQYKCFKFTFKDALEVCGPNDTWVETEEVGLYFKYETQDPTCVAQINDQIYINLFVVSFRSKLVRNVSFSKNK